MACALSVEAQSGGIGERDRGAKHRRHEMIIEGRYVKADKDGTRYSSELPFRGSFGPLDLERPYGTAVLAAVLLTEAWP